MFAVVSTLANTGDTRADGLENVHQSPAANSNPSRQQIASSDGPFSDTNVERRISDSVRFLASDELEGRGVGRDGLAQAAQYVANYFAQEGLRVDLWDGTPYQTFRVSGVSRATEDSINYLRATQFDAVSGAANWEILGSLGNDFQTLSVGENGQFNAPIVFAGYGITAQEDGLYYDDYASVDVRGKVVILLRKEPQQADPNSRFSGQKSSKHAFFTSKVANAVAHGASAVIFVNDQISISDGTPESGKQIDTLPPAEIAGDKPDRPMVPTFFASRKFVQALLDHQEQGVTLTQIEEQIDRTLKPYSFQLTSLAMAGQAELVQQDLMTSNVIAMLPGQGSLKDEAVVVGAHYDHVGMGEYGSLAPGVVAIHNGADDNASGTAALLELSKRFAAQARQRPADYRTVIFAAFSGEERGLLGSKYYVQHPLCPSRLTNAMINLDMIGRMGDNQVIVYGAGSSPNFPSMLESTSAAAGLRLNVQQPAMGPSDHQPFFDHSVPVLHFFTGIHAQYHRPTDDFEKINATGIVRITDIVYRLADGLASQPGLIPFTKVAGRANIQIPSSERGTLGIRMTDSPAGVRISEIQAGTPADLIGLQLMDVIEQVDGRQIGSVESMISTMQTYLPADNLVLQIRRANEIMKIPVKLGHN